MTEQSSGLIGDSLSPPTKPDRGNWRQYYTCFAVSMIGLSCGLSQGWASPMSQVLLSDDSPTGKMDQSQISIMQTISMYSGVVGVIFIIITLIRYGLKMSSYLQGVVNLIGWVLLLTATSPLSVYAGRLCTGVTTIGSGVAGAFFLSEVCSDGIRGTLISMSVFSINVGTLFGFALGTVCSYRLLNALCLPPAIAFLVLLYFLPQVPADLARFGKIEDAIQSYTWYRGVSYENAKEIIERMVAGRTEFRPIEMFKVKANQRAVVILTFVNVFAVLSGSAIIGSYASEIFRNANSNLTPNQSALILASVTFLASLLGVVTIDLVGRRWLVIGAFVMMTISLYIVLGYFIGMNQGWLPSNPQWIIYFSLSEFTCAHAFGISAVSQTLGAEMVGPKVKGPLWLIAGLSSLMLSALSLVIYAQITTHLPYYVNFIPAAVFSTAAIVIAWFVVPETKGKSLDVITAELSDTGFWRQRKG